MSRNFCSVETHTRSWYVACKSAEIKQGRARTVFLLGKKIVVFRTASGVVGALDARCPHLGADLGKGKVVGEGIRCAFHHWEFGCDGGCTAAPGLDRIPNRRTRTYPCREKWGYVWIWNGPAVLFDLPDIPGGFRVIRMPSQTLRCHPHIVVANGLDVSHFTALHGMVLEDSELREKPPFSVGVSFRGYPVSKALRFLMGASRKSIDASFETIGGNIAVATVRSPVPFAMIFTGNLTAAGHCQTHTIAFLPRKLLPDFPRALVSMYLLLHDDRRILDDIEFSPAFVETDKPLAKFAKIVDGMKTW